MASGATSGRVLSYENKQFNDLLGWSCDPGIATANTAISGAAVVQLMRIALPESISVTNVHVDLTTAGGSTLTHSWVALWKSDGTVIGQTADVNATWDTGSPTGIETLALASGPFTIAPLSATDFIWAGIYCGTSAGTVPKFASTVATPAATHLNIGCTTARSRMATIALADSATAAAFTPSGITPANTLFFVGLS